MSVKMHSSQFDPIHLLISVYQGSGLNLQPPQQCPGASTDGLNAGTVLMFCLRVGIWTKSLVIVIL